MIEFSHVYKTYPGPVHALRDIDLKIEKGEFVFLTGPSGAGKTTLFKMISAYDLVTSGEVQVAGLDLTRIAPAQVAQFRRRIGVVFQDFKLVKNWTVLENVALPLEVLGLPERLARARVGEALERVGLQGRGSELAGTLSGGEQQRVAVARAIVGEPALLLADEPTGNLDPQLAVDILGLLEDINDTGVTVVFATHDRSLLDIRPRRVVVLDDGKATDVPSGLDELLEPVVDDDGRRVA